MRLQLRNIFFPKDTKIGIFGFLRASAAPTKRCNKIKVYILSDGLFKLCLLVGLVKIMSLSAHKMEPRDHAIFVATGMPPGAEFGFDLASWTVGPRFTGVKLVPPGIHLVTTASEPGAPRTPRVLLFSPHQVIVGVWDRSEERLRIGQEDEVDEEMAERYAAAARRGEFDSGSAPYPENGNTNAEGGSGRVSWPDITSHIDKAALGRVEPVRRRSMQNDGGVKQQPASIKPDNASLLEEGITAMSIAEVTERDTAHNASLDSWHRAAMGLASPAPDSTTDDVISSERALANDPRVKALRAEAAASDAAADASLSQHQSSWFWSVVPGTGRGADPSAKTAHAIDTSSALEELARGLRKRLGWKASVQSDEYETIVLDDVTHHLLSELQLSFLLAFVGHSQGCLSQWKDLVDAVCRAEDAALALCTGRQASTFLALSSPSASILIKALEVLASQIPVLPEDVFGAEGMSESDADRQGEEEGSGADIVREILDESEEVAASPSSSCSSAAACQCKKKASKRQGGASSNFLHRGLTELSKTCDTISRSSSHAQSSVDRQSISSAFVGLARQLILLCNKRFGWAVREPAKGSALLASAPTVNPAAVPTSTSSSSNASANGAGVTSGGGERVFTSRAALLAALAEEAGEYGDEGMPAIVEDL